MQADGLRENEQGTGTFDTRTDKHSVQYAPRPADGGRVRACVSWTQHCGEWNHALQGGRVEWMAEGRVATGQSQQ
jgi:hypothetical protein